MSDKEQALKDLNKYTKTELAQLVMALLAEIEEADAVTAAESPVEVAPEKVTEETVSRPYSPAEEKAVTPVWGPLDADYCQVFWPIVDRYETYKEGDRVQRYLARMNPVFQQTYMVKPENGFIDDAHETAFSRSWNANMKLFTIQLAGGAQDSGFILGPVYTEFEAEGWIGKYLPALFSKKRLGQGTAALPNAKQPWNNHADPDKVRTDFEQWFLSDRPWNLFLQRAASDLRKLDNSYAHLGANKEAQDKFIADNPGYEPPAEEGVIADPRDYWTADRKARLAAALSNPDRLAMLGIKRKK